jgi:heat-inducible transcriptional repressor
VVVLSDGAVERYAIELSEDDETRVSEVSAHLHAHLTNRTLGRVDDVLLSGDPVVDRLINACLRELSLASQPADTDQVYVGGTARMAEAFEAVETVRSVLTILEQSVVVVSLLKDVLANGRNVSIGAENGIEPLSECSLVVAPYEGGAHVSGTVGVLGPTRMDYAQALAAVAAVGQSLSRQLTEG